MSETSIVLIRRASVVLAASLLLAPAASAIKQIDTTPPTGTIVINNGAAYTNATTVTLSLSAIDNSGRVAQMRFSNDGTNYSPPEPYATTRSWTLTTGNGTKSVYVKYSDPSGNWSVPASDTIILDTTAPLVTISSPSNGALLNTTAVTVSGSVDDGPGSGVESVTVNGQPATLTGSSFSTTLTLPEGLNQPIAAIATDRAANRATASIQVSVDITPPTGTVSINSGATYTRTRTVTLSLSATDNFGTVSQMKFSNDNLNYTPPEPYATTKSWTLTSGDGTKTVYVKFADPAGNWSDPASDTIILDTVAPIVSISSPTNGAYLATSTVTVTGTVDDPQATVSVNGVPASVNPAGNFSATITLIEGPNRITATATDPARNSHSQSVDVTVDTTPPQVMITCPVNQAQIGPSTPLCP